MAALQSGAHTKNSISNYNTSLIPMFIPKIQICGLKSFFAHI